MRSRLPLVLAGLFALAATALTLASGPRPGARFTAQALVPAARAELPSPAPPSLSALSALSALPALTAPSPPAPPAIERADAHLIRRFRAPLAGGLLTFPPSFASEDGRYDLVLHFNGNTDLVEESYGHAGVNAVVMILNLGVGSGVYEDRFEDPAAFALILARVQSVLTARGLRSPRLGRVAVSGWSSGYGGVLKLLGQDALFEKLDAVVLLDAIHCGYKPGTKILRPDQLEPMRRFARKAMEGRALLSIAHSEIATIGYLDAHRTTDAVLEGVGLRRGWTTTGQEMPVLRTMVGVLPRAQMVPLTPLTEVHQGELHVRGYDGNGPITHMLHLVQMSTTALPDLVRYWGR